MKIQLSWLREYVDVGAPAEEIAATMSVRGFAVEGIELVGSEAADAPPPRPDSADLPRRSAEGTKADRIIDFEITANRPDCMSVVGIAREVATAFGVALRDPRSRLHEAVTAAAGVPASGAGSPALDVMIDNPELCARYVGAVADVAVGPSPEWMQTRLRSAGVRPISNVVDVTAYVMLELGQPMHAFDYTRIGGSQIRVRTAQAGERLRTLDGQVRELTPGMLVIADASEPVAVAGVMGGGDSEVTARTERIVLESAWFNPLSVRRTSRQLGLKTEASMRFERGADPTLPAIAMRRACELLEEIGAGRAIGEAIDRYVAPVETTTLRLRRAKLDGLLGVAIPDTDVTRILEGLGFSLRPVNDGAAQGNAAWKVTVPPRRVDVAREVDLIEEIARHFGFDRVPVRFPAVSAAPARMDPRITRARQLRATLTGAGFSEALTFGFIAADAAAAFVRDGDVAGIANPLSENFAVLRPSVLPGLVEAVAHNRRREQRDIRLFEIGARFTRGGGESRAIACAWAGTVGGDHWSGGSRPVDFYDMKGLVERIGTALAVDVRAEVAREPWLAPGRAAAAMWNGTRLGVFGQLAAGVAERHGFAPNEAVYVAEIDLDTAERVSAPAVRVAPLPKYPSVTRDISIVVADTLAAADVRRTVVEAAPATLVRVREFDRYQGTGVPEGRVSLSLRLTFRSAERTLTDAEVQEAMEAVLAALRQRHGAVQR